MVISKLRINLGYKTFFNLNFILTYNTYMYVPVLSSLFYFVPCCRYGSWISFFWLIHWTISVTPFLHVVECSQIIVELLQEQQDSLAWIVICFLDALNRSAIHCIFSCNVQNEHLFTPVTLTWWPCCLNLSTLAHIYICYGNQKNIPGARVERTNNKFNAMYAFTSTVFKPGIHSPCWKVHAVTLPSAIPPPLFCHRIRHLLFY